MTREHVTGIVLRTYNHREMTLRCVESLERHTMYPHRLVAVDDGSTDGTPDALQAGGIEVLRYPAGTAVTVTLNAGLRRLLADPAVAHLVSIHTDMVFMPRWIEPLIDYLDRNAPAGKVAPRNLKGDPGDWTPEAVAAYVAAHRDEVRPGNGEPWAMRRSVLEKVGFFDEGYLGIGGYEDWDYNNRVLEHGYQVLIVGASAVWHEGMGTRRYVDQTVNARHNFERYVARWGPGARV